MEIGFVGLGRMGKNMVLRLLRDGDHRVVVWNRSDEPVKEVAGKGAVPAESVEDLVGKLEAPTGQKTVWLMLPAGKITGEMVEQVAGLLSKDDVIVDGANSRYTDTIERAKSLSGKGIGFVDAGTSGGIWGLEVGYCLMAGGTKKAFAQVEPALKTLAPPDGYLHTGPAGSGHYTKMVHNAVEYGMMQAYAEGFELLRASGFEIDLRAVSHLWNQGSVVRSWLLELAEIAFSEDADLSKIDDHVDESGEGRWSMIDALERGVPAPVLAMALTMRARSRQDSSFGGKVLAALRNQFGGHAVKAAQPGE